MSDEGRNRRTGNLGRRAWLASSCALLLSRLVLLPTGCSCLQQFSSQQANVNLSSRRAWLASSAAALVSAAGVRPVIAAEEQAVAPLGPPTSRQELLAAIDRKASDTVILNLIDRLPDPSNRQVLNYPERLDGQWELIWSYGAEGFSPLLKLPPPFKPDSYQYFGSAAAPEVGAGRIAQGLTGGILGKDRQLWLSSGAIPLDGSVLEIQPPFRLELGGPYQSKVPKQVLVEAGSDEDFRKTNGRTAQAQAAGKNQYQQLYVENQGPGSIRISTVIAGDPVLVGEVFVHRKL